MTNETTDMRGAIAAPEVFQTPPEALNLPPDKNDPFGWLRGRSVSTGPCTQCGKECGQVHWFGIPQDTTCDRCFEAHCVRMDGPKRQQRLESFLLRHEHARRYTNTVRDRLRMPEMLDGATEWLATALRQTRTADCRGLYLIGGSGLGKTRVAFKILLDAVASGKLDSPVVIPCNDFRNFIDAMNPTLQQQELERWKGWSMVCLDDLGKEATDEKSFRAIYSIITERTDRCLPTIITTQYSTTELTKKYDGISRVDAKDIAALMRRIKQYFTPLGEIPPKRPDAKTAI